MMTKLNKLAHDSKGANLVEYIILVGVIALIALAGFRAFGSSVLNRVNDQKSQVDGIK